MVHTLYFNIKEEIFYKIVELLLYPISYILIVFDFKERMDFVRTHESDIIQSVIKIFQNHSLIYRQYSI